MNVKAIESKIVFWIKKKLVQAKAKGVVFGISGGVDSAVVAALVKKAVGKQHLALVLPCHSSKQALSDAKLVINALGLNSKLLDITQVFDLLIKIFPRGNNLSLANLKPRLRMLSLYYFANKLNYLVAGTGNKSELLVGYFTKYGDGGVDILPIADLFKFEVRILAQHLGIPEDIINKAPTADLWEGQTDEGEMGITYNELDLILSNLSRKKRINISQQKIKKVKSLIGASVHKRSLPEICKI